MHRLRRFPARLSIFSHRLVGFPYFYYYFYNFIIIIFMPFSLRRNNTNKWIRQAFANPIINKHKRTRKILVHVFYFTYELSCEKISSDSHIHTFQYMQSTTGKSFDGDLEFILRIRLTVRDWLHSKYYVGLIRVHLVCLSSKIYK